MGWDWLVTLVLVLHFAYIAYLVLGGFLAWRWLVAIWPHLAAAAWASLIVAKLVNCPLTYAEVWAREKAGQPAPVGGFIDRYLTNVIYPARYAAVAQAAVAVVVAASWFGAYRAHRHRRAEREAEGDGSREPGAGTAAGTAAERRGDARPLRGVPTRP